MLKYRHELKFFINRCDYELLSRRLSLTMKRDKFADANGEYFIRSLYFDDLDNTAFMQKMDGVEARDKYRLRTYNLNGSRIKLECKHKTGQFIAKQSLTITKEECNSLLAGDARFLMEKDSGFARQMYVKFAVDNLKPRVIVDYMREAYVFPVEETRVTFDKNVRTAMFRTDLFDPHLPTFPAIDTMIMEVKFNRFFPTNIRALIQLPAHSRSAISKYCFCRKYEL